MSLAVLAMATTLVMPERAVGMASLIWIAVLIPGFLLAYFRGLGDAAVIIATCMVALTGLRVLESSADVEGAVGTPPPWLIVVIAALVVVLIELRARELRRTSAVDLVDARTGLPSRSFFDLSAERAFAAAQRGAPLVVVKFELDGLDGIEQRFGKPAVETALRAFADALRRETRREDVSARHDGNGFATILSYGSTAGVDAFARRVLERFAHSQFQWGTQTACAGIAVFEATMPAFSFLTDEAERAVHRAQAAGRGQVGLPLGDAERAAIRRESMRITKDHVSVAAFAAQRAPTPRQTATPPDSPGT